MIKKIAITGPESTGKTWLTRELAGYYNTTWVPEFAREYLSETGRPYYYDDILIIARNQFRLNNEAFQSAKQYLFCDTELIVAKIWCDVKYGKCHPWIDKHILRQNFDLYLLTDIDLPWEPDPQREHPQPHMRQHLMGLYINELESRSFPYRIVSGRQEERFRNAINALRELIG